MSDNGAFGGAPPGDGFVPSPPDLLQRLTGLDVLVLGDTALDCWSFGHAERLGREGPVPVVEIGSEEESPGAAGNLAANAAALGARVRVAGIVGADPAGDALLEALRGRNVDVDLVVRDRTRPTVTKHRVVCDGLVTARFDRNVRMAWSEASRRELMGRLSDVIRGADLVMVSDYGMGTIDAAVRAAVAVHRPYLSGPLLVDGHDFSAWADSHPTAVTPNAEEAGRLLGRPLATPGRARAVLGNAAELMARSGSELVLVTLDAEGSVLLRRQSEPHLTPGVPVSPQHTCGAGDTVSAMFGLALAAGVGPDASADLAATAAACVVDRPGTCCCSREDLLASLLRPGHAGVLTHSALARVVEARRAAGARIVFTNGCFDVLHLGHVQYLREARALGDMLVVAVNSDASVQRLKGEGRPVVPDRERAGVLAALDVVDAVTIFHQDTPRALIEMLRPELYVKGGDYMPSMLPEAALVERLGGRVVTVGYLRDHSTTGLLQRIQADRADSTERS